MRIYMLIYLVWIIMFNSWYKHGMGKTRFKNLEFSLWITLNPCFADFFLVKHNDIIVSYILFEHWDVPGSWKSASWKTRTYLSHTISCLLMAWPCEEYSQNIKRHGIDPVAAKYSSFSTRRVHFVLELFLSCILSFWAQMLSVCFVSVIWMSPHTHTLTRWQMHVMAVDIPAQLIPLT